MYKKVHNPGVCCPRTPTSKKEEEENDFTFFRWYLFASAYFLMYGLFL